MLRKQILTRDSTMSRPSAAEKDIAARDAALLMVRGLATRLLLLQG